MLYTNCCNIFFLAGAEIVMFNDLVVWDETFLSPLEPIMSPLTNLNTDFILCERIHLKVDGEKVFHLFN